jgi:hypothetical protein
LTTCARALCGCTALSANLYCCVDGQAPGTVTEIPVDVDPSQLLEVASALKHGQVIPWDLARRVWSSKPISNVGLFGLLVSTWPAFLDVSWWLYHCV